MPAALDEAAEKVDLRELQAPVLLDAVRELELLDGADGAAAVGAVHLDREAGPAEVVLGDANVMAGHAALERARAEMMEAVHRRATGVGPRERGLVLGL